ncbi:hypothetical protein N7519_006693 [Penicillium mononematosum]|uniref:uncharacterized protein n=1 Tax=Penicillium mononematosum TaxID=268346 RepID=UPI00254747A6|nr:uncharacterized protein N7519_006693 [Penicillium mononematosum]KAJ6185392.1 hypothetical protein N7519_006693 [Penicillium mononematosum]
MADFIMPRTNCQDPDVLSSDKKAKTRPKLSKAHINMATLWCLQCFRYAVRQLDDEPPVFDVPCRINIACPQSCVICAVEGKNIPQGIRGHVFELMALIKFVEKYWTDDIEYMDGDKSREKALAELATTVNDLCTAFDDLVETHRKDHMLTGNVSDEAKAGYFAWCKARQHMVRPNTQYIKGLHFQYARRATEHLRLRMGEEASISWAAAICAFYLAVTATVTKYVTSGSDVDYIDDQFPLEMPEL